ncbi:MAG TPA: alpha/beta hydrolase domain-containing protein [Alphaproteobacteria bacterium]|nr:alpha/beta hydrolase domain-containing protein [Alphaproteobacteria bacterium]
MIGLKGALAAVLTVSAVALPAEARVTRLVIEETQSPAFGGKSFGSTGQYTVLSGHFDGELDPADPANAIITDIALAPRNRRGMVEYSATFTLAEPTDMSKASGVMLYQVPNRGHGINFGGDAAGDVSLMSGWQGDIPPKPGLETIQVPVARNPDGSSVTGPALAVFVNMPAGARSLPLSGGVGMPTPRPEPASLDTAKATLMRRSAPDAEPAPVPSGDWAFADCTASPFPGTPDPHSLCLKDGFDPAFRYELSYTAKDPLVLGIGFAATRDINAFFRHAEKDDAGTLNPVAGRIAKAIGIGFSQSGNFIRSFIHLGFNRDEAGRMVWDGAEPVIAGRQLVLNMRFAAASGAAGPFEPGSEGTLWWSDYPDPARGRRPAGLLDRCYATKTCPKIFEIFGASEFWGLRMSPNLVGTDAKADIPLPPEVRRYYVLGVSHGGGEGGFSLAADMKALSVTGVCSLAANPLPELDTVRALTADLVDWVAKGTEPPASRYPTLAKHELVAADAAAMGFPTIPGEPSPDGKLNPFVDQDFGSGFNAADMSGAPSLEPPKLHGILPSLVPKVDKDGNEAVDGVRPVLLQEPLGTYLGWNVAAGGFYKGRGCGFTGGWIPFVRTKARRLEAKDPRPSIEERYKTHEAYVALVKTAADKAVADRFLLPADAARIVGEAEAGDIAKTR